MDSKDVRIYYTLCFSIDSWLKIRKLCLFPKTQFFVKSVGSKLQYQVKIGKMLDLYRFLVAPTEAK